MKFSLMEIQTGDCDKIFSVWYFQNGWFQGALFEIYFAENTVSFDFLFINGIRKYLMYEYEKYKYQ